MKIKKIISSEMDQNCYLIYENNKGILIDPGFDGKKILKECGDLDIEYILLTHCHYDHLKFLEYIVKNKNSKVVSSKNCQKNMTDSLKNVSVNFGNPVSFKKSDMVLEDGEVLNSAVGDIKCIYTPGHTNCSVCYIVENHIFSGDTLFNSSIGRWDLPTGNINNLVDSIKNKIYPIGDDFIIHTGHGGDTTVSKEKRFNVYVKADK